MTSLTNSDGVLLASTVASDEDNTYISSFTNIWYDYLEIAKAKLTEDEEKIVKLNFAILDYEVASCFLSSPLITRFRKEKLL